MATAQKKPKRYYWWRLKKNFFTQITIKKLRRSDNGDKKALIYLQMILMTIDNDGYIQFEGVEDDIGDEIAIALDEEPEIVHETIKQLIDMRLIEMVEEDYFLPEAKGGIDSECDSAERVRKTRAKKKMLQSNTDVTQSNTQVTKSNTDVTQSREEKSREREEKSREREEKEKEKEKEKELELEPRSHSTSGTKLLGAEEITGLFNRYCESYDKIDDCMKYSGVLSDCIFKRYSVKEYQTAFINAENSDYLKGLTENKNYPSTFDWILEHLEEVKSGKYNSYGQKAPELENIPENAKIMLDGSLDYSGGYFSD